MPLKCCQTSVLLVHSRVSVHTARYAAPTRSQARNVMKCLRLLRPTQLARNMQWWSISTMQDPHVLQVAVTFIPVRNPCMQVCCLGTILVSGLAIVLNLVLSTARANTVFQHCDKDAAMLTCSGELEGAWETGRFCRRCSCHTVLPGLTCQGHYSLCTPLSSLKMSLLGLTIAMRGLAYIECVMKTTLLMQWCERAGVHPCLDCAKCWLCTSERHSKLSISQKLDELSGLVQQRGLAEAK